MINSGAPIWIAEGGVDHETNDRSGENIHHYLGSLSSLAPWREVLSLQSLFSLSYWFVENEVYFLKKQKEKGLMATPVNTVGCNLLYFGLDIQREAIENDDDDEPPILRLPERQSCLYTTCYCEENVWTLIDNVRQTQPHMLGTVYAVFISNDNKMIPLWEQRGGRGEEKVVFWDYHVFLIFCNGEGSCVYDLDSTLPFPVDFSLYARRAIRTNRKIIPHYHRKVRVIPGEIYLDNFASDRSHMKKQNGSYRQPPPDYPAIRTADQTNNIHDFISMNPKVGYGEVMSIRQFFETF